MVEVPVVFVVVEAEASEVIETSCIQMEINIIIVSCELQTVPPPSEAMFVERVRLVLQLILRSTDVVVGFEVVVSPQDVCEISLIVANSATSVLSLPQSTGDIADRKRPLSDLENPISVFTANGTPAPAGQLAQPTPTVR